MFSLHDRPSRLCDKISRRELMQIGGVGLMGLSLPALLGARAQAAASASKDPMFGRAKNIIFLYLQGGPAQHSTWDPKPNAPEEIRGLFKPISTNVPGIQISELLPRTARMADKLAIVRSMSTQENTHENSGYWVMTGYKYGSGVAREIKPSDWPYFGSIVKMLKPSERVPALSTVWIPDVMRLNDNVRPGGQTGGFLGSQWDPDYFIGDPSQSDYQVQGLGLQPEITPLRLNERMSLLSQVGGHLDRVERSGVVKNFDDIRQAAFGLLTSGGARQAFAVQREPEHVRERYGNNRWGQCVLLARRLIEAGVRMVHVNWTREPGDDAVDNPMWDTHTQEADRLQDALCPQFDVGFTALIEDLEQRGLLDETLVVAIGEFGRTPKINKDGGRDHWGSVFSFVMAGAGISGGQVYGSSDKIGGWPASNRVQPEELTATIFHLLGVDHHGTFRDRLGRPMHITKGEPLHMLLGTQPATIQRCAAGGDVAQVPPYEPGLLRNADFSSPAPLVPHGAGPLVKGWHASPIVGHTGKANYGVQLVQSTTARQPAKQRATIGFGLSGSPTRFTVPADSIAMLSQEARSPRAGRFTFVVHARGCGSTGDYYRNVFLKQFGCRIAIFRFVDTEKDHRRRHEFVSAELRPTWTPTDDLSFTPLEVSTRLRSQDDGAREIAQGIGVAIILEPVASGSLQVEPGESAWIEIDRVELNFDPRPRNDDIKI